MTPNNEARHLSVAIGLPLLGGLSPDEHARVLRHARVFTFLRDQPIFRVGEPATAVYFLLDGLVKVMYGNPRGDESTIGEGFEPCCAKDHRPLVQERAWTSPIWYRPAAASGDVAP